MVSPTARAKGAHMPTQTRRRLPLTTDFTPPEGTHTVVVLTDHYWGKGATKAEAMKQVKKHGGNPATTGYIAYYFTEGLTFNSVDDMGRTSWTYTVSKATLDANPGMNSVPVKEEVLHPSPKGE